MPDMNEVENTGALGDTAVKQVNKSKMVMNPSDRNFNVKSTRTPTSGMVPEAFTMPIKGPDKGNG